MSRTSTGAGPSAVSRVDASRPSALVTVVCGSRRLDVELPAEMPVGDLMPTLVRVLAPRTAPGSAARHWQFAPVTGEPIGPASSLADRGVRDGDILMLSDRVAMHPGPAEVTDVRAAVESAARAGRGTARLAAAFCAWLLGVGGVALAPVAALVADRGSLAIVGVAGGLTGAAAAVAVRAIAPTACLAAVVGAAAWAGTAAVAAAGGWGGSPVAASCAGLAAALAITVLLLPLVPRAAVIAIGMLVVAAGAGALAAGAAAGLTALTTARLLGLVAVCAVGLTPRSAVAVAGLLAIDERHRRGPPVGSAEVDGAALRAGAAAAGLLAGLGGVVAVTATVLSLSTSGWDLAAAALLGSTLLARSRLASRASHVTTLWLSGLAALGAAAVGVGLRSPGAIPALIVVALTAAGAVAVAAAASRSWTSATMARLHQGAALADRVLPAAALAVAAGGFGLYTWVGDVLTAIG